MSGYIRDSRVPLLTRTLDKILEYSSFLHDCLKKYRLLHLEEETGQRLDSLQCTDTSESDCLTPNTPCELNPDVIMTVVNKLPLPSEKALSRGGIL